MVISIDTDLTQRAVPAPRSPNNLTVGTQTARLQRVQKFDKVEIGVFLETAGVREPNYNAKED